MQVKEYAANTIVEKNMLFQVDSEGFASTLIDGIVDYAKDNSAVLKSELFATTKRGGG